MSFTRRILGISTFIFLFLVAFAQADILEGLIMYLPFNEGQGKVAGDLSGNGHNGDLEGPEWTDGKFDKGLLFNGEDSFVEVPFDDAFIVKDGLTLGAWVTANMPFDPQWKGVINAQKSTYGPFLMQTGGASKAEIGLFLGGAWTWIRSGNALEPDVYHQVVGVFDMEEGLHIYFDGQLDDGEGSIGAKAAEIDDAPDEGIVIGHNYNLAGRFWDGAIDEVMIYNRALSADEVAQLFETPLSDAMAVEAAGKLASAWGRVKNN